MLRLPDGLSWPRLCALVAAVGAGVYATGEFQERRELIETLETYAAATPARAELARTVADCNRSIIVDVKGCGDRLLARFGPEVIDQMAEMAAAGAFGQP